MTWSGTQAGKLESWDVPDTGQAMGRAVAIFWRVDCGRIAEAWVVPDNLTLLRQLGVVTDDELADGSAPTVATQAS